MVAVEAVFEKAEQNHMQEVGISHSEKLTKNSSSLSKKDQRKKKKRMMVVMVVTT
jgi:hypothetical protein